MNIPEAYTALKQGVQLVAAGDYEAAIDWFNMALTLVPDWEAAYRARAEALRKLGRTAEAAHDLEAADSIMRHPERVRPAAAFTQKAGTDIKAFWTSFLWVAVPVIFFGVISTLGEKDVNKAGAGLGLLLYFFWLVGAGAWLVGVGFLIFNRRKSQAPLGILAGLAVGSVALALTCFSNSRSF